MKREVFWSLVLDLGVRIPTNQPLVQLSTDIDFQVKVDRIISDCFIS